MSENILKVGKVLESWVTLDLSHKGLLDKKPSISYIGSSSLSYPPTKNILSSLDGEELIKGLFVAYNLLNGDDDKTALQKANTIHTIDYVKSESDEYFGEVDCDICEGQGQIPCEMCDGLGYEDCGNCEGVGNDECGKCNGEGVDEDGDSCTYCDGDGSITCEDCEGDATVDCNYCEGSGNNECSECEGNGEVEGSTEKIDIEYGTIITQNLDMVNELNKRTNDQREEVIDGFNKWVDRYKNEILIVDKIDDTIDYYHEWEVGDEEAKLEGVRINKLNEYKVGNRSGQITSLSTR